MHRALRGLSFVLLTACGQSAPPREATPPAAPGIPIYEAGEVAGELRETRRETGSEQSEVEGAVSAEGVPVPAPEERPLTLLDLRDDFAPRIFNPAPELGPLGTPPYRSTYVQLADELLGELPDDVEPEKYLEVFGIFPTFRVLTQRLTDDERHECHNEVDVTWLRTLPYLLKFTDIDVAAERRRVSAYERELPLFLAEQGERGLPTLEALEGVTARARQFNQFLKDQRRVEVVRAIQAHLRCDGLIQGNVVSGVLDTPTSEALALWQRRHMLYAAGSVDETTVTTMRISSRELDFRGVLRTLRERVVDASGVIEDGSARHEWGTILGRTVDAPELQASAGHRPREDGAPDWVSPATEAAAEALGWTSPESFIAFGAAGHPEQVAVHLPSPPSYHSAHTPLRAEIDRGDVNYELPRDIRGGRDAVVRRPVITIFARDGDREVALVQWPTTIGGWMRENARGGIALKYKESPVGPRVWRDVIAAPAWIPPASTPVGDLIRYVGRDRIVPNTTLFGPGYRSAYGLAMVVHNRRDDNEMGGGDPMFVDEGVRSHGSVAYRSILTGSSHGCHRLHNHLAVRLTGFLLAHRRHVARGSLLVRHSRELRTSVGTATFRIRSRGFAYELTPPMEVEVLEGSIIGRRTTPDTRFRPVRAE